MIPRALLALVVACAGLPAGAEEPRLQRCLVSFLREGEVKVPAREPGVLVKLAVREGQVVAVGEVLGQIDDDQPQMEKRKAQAEHDQAVARAQSDVDIRFAKEASLVARLEWDKAEESHRRAPQSVSEIDRKRLELNWTKSLLQIEQSELEQKLASLTADSKQVEVEVASKGIERRLVTSPVNGEVDEVFTNLGEWLQPGDPLVRVVRFDTLRVEGYVDSARWDPEQIRDRPVTVTVTLAKDRTETFTGRIIHVKQAVESGGDYRVWAEVENRRERDSEIWIMRPGMTATMEIHSSRPPLAVRHPASGLRGDPVSGLRGDSASGLAR
jgi:multidrug efflux pump subunit AcrA (membrane-fusion protein)